MTIIWGIHAKICIFKVQDVNKSFKSLPCRNRTSFNSNPPRQEEPRSRRHPGRRFFPPQKMASSSSFRPFALKTLPTNSLKFYRNLSLPNPNPNPNPNPIFSSSSTKTLTLTLKVQQRSFISRAVVDDDEWGKEREDENGGVAIAEGEEEGGGGEIESEIGELKKRLKEMLCGTDRGLKASSEMRAEILELITQLESKNPTPAPTDSLTLLNGKWILAYTSFSQLFPLLGSGSLPELVKVDEISQTIDSDSFTVQNSVKFAGPLATTSVTTNAKFEVRSPKRVQIKFEEGIIGTPQLTDSLVIPDKVEFFGQNVDLSPLKGVITSIQDSYSSVAKTISSQPPLKIPITNDNAQSWLLTTYLDDELRISRGDGGSVFVLIKEGSSLLNE